MYMYISNVLSSNTTNETHKGDIKVRIVSNDSSKSATYKLHNPTLSVMRMYTQHIVPEHQRIAYSRFRLSSHNLKIETGRWTRTPRERRTCTCEHGGIQDECHIIRDCTLLNELRSNYTHTTFDVPNFHNNEIEAAKYIFDAIRLIN